MKVITFGEIVDGGASVFHSVATLDAHSLKHRFEGVIRVDNPYRFLKGHIDELSAKLPELGLQELVIDFTDLHFCNSNGFYVIMDVVEALYLGSGDAKVIVRRIGAKARGATVIIIAHRLSTVEIADRILVMGAGEIVEDGPAAQLRSGTGRFATLHTAWLDSLV